MSNEITIISVEEQLKTDIKKFSFVDDQLEKIKQEVDSLQIISADDRKGFKAVDSARKAANKLVSNVEKKRKELVSDAVTYQRGVNAEAKRIKGLITPIQTSIQKKIDAYDKMVKEKEEKEQEEREAKISKRIQRLNEINAGFDYLTVFKMTDEDFEKFFDESNIIYEQKLKEEEKEKEKQAEKDRLMKSRVDQLMKDGLHLFTDMDTIDFGSLTEEKFAVILSRAKDKKKDHQDQIEQAQRIQEQNEKEEKLESSRKNKLIDLGLQEFFNFASIDLRRDPDSKFDDFVDSAADKKSDHDKLQKEKEELELQNKEKQEKIDAYEKEQKEKEKAERDLKEQEEQRQKEEDERIRLEKLRPDFEKVEKFIEDIHLPDLPEFDNQEFYKVTNKATDLLMELKKSLYTSLELIK